MTGPAYDFGDRIEAEVRTEVDRLVTKIKLANAKSGSSPLETKAHYLIRPFSNAAIHSLARFYASASCSGVMDFATASRVSAYSCWFSDDASAAARLRHLCAST